MKITLLIMFLISSLTANAKVAREELTINHTNGEEIDISLVSYINENETLEVRIEGAFFGDKLKSLNPVLGYGRDLDSNGKIDTWFILDINTGLKVIKAEGKKRLGQDILGRKVFLNEDAKVFYRRSVVAGILSHVFLSYHYGYEAHFEFYRRTIDLEEFKIRLEQDSARLIPLLSKEQLNWSFFLISEGYKSAQEEFETAVGSDYVKLSTVDGILWGTGGYFAKWGLKGIRFLSSQATKLLSKTGTHQIFTKFAGSKVNYLKSQKNIFTSKLGKLKSSKPIANVIMTKALLKSSTNAAMTSLSMKHKMTHKVLQTLGNAGLEGIKKWKYVAMVGVTSTMSETYYSYDRLKDEDPAQTAINVLNDPDIMKNIEYMTMQTFLATAASSTVTSTYTQFGICGLVALGHSGVKNILLAENPDYKRIALDTRWEVIVGSTQTVIDLKAISYFEKLALKKGNPRLKLIGYAVVFVEQLVGSYYYAKTTAPKAENLTVVPVFASN
jgi:hypothetical protein